MNCHDPAQSALLPDGYSVEQLEDNVRRLSLQECIRIGYKEDPNRCRKHIFSALQHFSNLTLIRSRLTGSKKLLCLNGTIPVKYRLVFIIFKSYVFKK